MLEHDNILAVPSATTDDISTFKEMNCSAEVKTAEAALTRFYRCGTTAEDAQIGNHGVELNIKHGTVSVAQILVGFRLPELNDTNLEADMRSIKDYYSSFTAKYPEKFTTE